MKKGTKIALAIGVVLLAVGATMVNIAVGRGEKADFSFGINGGRMFSGVNQNGYTVCTEGEVSFDVSDVEKLDLDWLSGTVSVEAYDGDELIVREKIDGSATDEMRMRWRLSGGELSVLPCANNVRNLPTKHLTVLVPRTAELRELSTDATSAYTKIDGVTLTGDLEVDSSSGDVEIVNCVCRAISADSTSGAQSVRDCACAGIKLNNTSGGKSIENCAVSGEVKIDGTSGSSGVRNLSCTGIEIDGTSGSVRLEELKCSGKADVVGSSGTVYISFAEAPSGVSVDSTSGDVTLVFPKGTGLDLDFDSASGKFSGELSSGSLRVEVDTTSGDLRIEYR